MNISSMQLGKRENAEADVAVVKEKMKEIEIPESLLAAILL